MKNLITIILSITLYQNTLAQNYTQKYIEEANKIGLEWWIEINSGDYEKAYQKLSKKLKDNSTYISWSNQMKMLMSEIGQFQSRNIKNTYFQSEIEGLEDGFYVTVEYEVIYSNTMEHTESILLKQNDEFIWQITNFNYSFRFKE
tara:strand:+ start:2221 stop:2655 length:435 start_codon:yes stop_codon:yes gene_type:complete